MAEQQVENVPEFVPHFTISLGFADLYSVMKFFAYFPELIEVCERLGIIYRWE